MTARHGCTALIDFKARCCACCRMLCRGLCAGLGATIAVVTTVTLAAPAWQPTQATGTSVAAPPVGLFLAILGDEPIERQLGGAVRGLFRELRRYVRVLSITATRAIDWWGKWIKRSLFYVAVAIVAALADASLVNAFRQDGLRTFATYVPMMLYVYTRLLFSGGVKLAPKLVLFGTIVYGVVWRDLLPDRKWIPGRLEDIVLIAIATRAFVYACPEELVDQYAQRAVRLRLRVTSFQRARQR